MLTHMWRTDTLFVLLLFFVYNYGNTSDEEPTLYYYGIEESERGLPACAVGRACSALVRRYWREDALVRLCRCPRRRRCDARAPADRRIELNNRAYFQFCDPVAAWRQCHTGETSLIIADNYDRMNPDDLEELHHKNIQMAPPNITFSCRCRTPHYWRLKSSVDDTSGFRHYKCGSLPLCRTGELCGHVTADMYALYQSCLCPKNHICVHNGGIANDVISELLYQGIGWKAYCQRVNDTSYEDY